jgi:hypothetical protein
VLLDLARLEAGLGRLRGAVAERLAEDIGDCGVQ